MHGAAMQSTLEKKDIEVFLKGQQGCLDISRRPMKQGEDYTRGNAFSPSTCSVAMDIRTDTEQATDRRRNSPSERRVAD